MALLFVGHRGCYRVTTQPCYSQRRTTLLFLLFLVGGGFLEFTQLSKIEGHQLSHCGMRAYGFTLKNILNMQQLTHRRHHVPQASRKTAPTNIVQVVHDRALWANIEDEDFLQEEGVKIIDGQRNKLHDTETSALLDWVKERDNNDDDIEDLSEYEFVVNGRMSNNNDEDADDDDDDDYSEKQDYIDDDDDNNVSNNNNRYESSGEEIASLNKRFDDEQEFVKKGMNGTIGYEIDEDEEDDDYSEKQDGINDEQESQEEIAIMKERLGRQQEYIDKLLQLVMDLKGQNTNTGIRKDGGLSRFSHPTTAVVPLKAMLFVDGTWLYYALYSREAGRCPIREKYGYGWHNRYDVDWNILPRVICEALEDRRWSSLDTTRPTEIVRTCVFSSYKAGTLSSTLRYQMFEEMKAANYDVNLIETVGKSEKCVDIQLAVEMLHYATMPEACDIAIILTGDKDFLPAMIRTRQKGRKVALVSMRSGCNRALKEANGIKDYDVVWLDDHVESFVLPKKTAELSEVEHVSLFTISKVLKDFIEKSGWDSVSARDIGRYLQRWNFGKENLLTAVRNVFGGISAFVVTSGVFTIVDEAHNAAFSVGLLPNAETTLLELAKTTKFTRVEKDFFDRYTTDVLNDRTTAYLYTLEMRGEMTGTPAGLNESDEPKQAAPDFSKFTVEMLKEYCRDRGLSTRGLKADLLERVVEDARGESEVDETNASFWSQRPSIDWSINVSKIPEATSSHLQGIVTEYLSVSGGKATSRDIGRYLQTNKNSDGSAPPKDSALKELKREYGTFSRFVEAYPDLYSKDDNVTGDVGFFVILKS